MGVLADMVNRPKLIAFGVALWSVFPALTGVAKGFVSMAIPRMFIGVGESILTPTSMSLLSDTFPSKGWALRLVLLYGSSYWRRCKLINSRLLRRIFNWRNCFILLGLIGLILGLCALLFKDRERKYNKSSDKVNQLSKETTINIVNTLIKLYKLPLHKIHYTCRSFLSYCSGSVRF